MGEKYAPDLTGAEIYVEAAERPIAGGQWYVLPDETVVYQQPDGALQPSIIGAAQLRTDTAGWKRLRHDPPQ